MKKKTTLKKPTLSNKDVLAFAERPSDAPQGDKTTKVGKGKGGAKKNSPANQNGLSGKVPSGDVRLSANIDQEIHLKLKIAAARERTTIGELIERLVQDNLD